MEGVIVIDPPQVHEAGDYASLTTRYGQFYYGYERVMCPEHGETCDPDACDNREWCFHAKLSDNTTEITVCYSKLKSSFNQFDCLQNLLVGIGWVLTKWTLNTKG